jgi:hypothetical protein
MHKYPIVNNRLNWDASRSVAANEFIIKEFDLLIIELEKKSSSVSSCSHNQRANLQLGSLP